MQRIALLLPLGLTSGLLVGLIAGGLVLNLILGRDPNATGIFVLIAEFPGFARLTSVPWVLPWQIVGASTVLFTVDRRPDLPPTAHRIRASQVPRAR